MFSYPSKHLMFWGRGLEPGREKQAGMKNGVSWGVVAVTRRSSSRGELRGERTLKSKAENKEGQHHRQEQGCSVDGGVPPLPQPAVHKAALSVTHGPNPGRLEFYIPLANSCCAG